MASAREKSLSNSSARVVITTIQRAFRNGGGKMKVRLTVSKIFIAGQRAGVNVGHENHHQKLKRQELFKHLLE